jgi:hypothetical protein
VRPSPKFEGQAVAILGGPSGGHPNYGAEVNLSPDIFGSSIVAVGAFNPAIFSPDWLLSIGVIGAGDRDAAVKSANLIVSQQVSSFETDWFRLQVVDNQFSIHSKVALSHAFRDLAHGILATVPHTPVTAIGLNFMGHFSMGSEERYHAVGDALVPKRIWHSVFPGETIDAGLGDLQVIIGRHKRGEAPSTPDRITMHIQPSSKVKVGIFVSLNDHYAAFARDKSKANADEAAKRLCSHIGSSHGRWPRKPLTDSSSKR